MRSLIFECMHNTESIMTGVIACTELWGHVPGRTSLSVEIHCTSLVGACRELPGNWSFGSGLIVPENRRLEAIKGKLAQEKASVT